MCGFDDHGEELERMPEPKPEQPKNTRERVVVALHEHPRYERKVRFALQDWLDQGNGRKEW